MGLLENLVIVFAAGLITALTTGLGALPFFLVEDFSDRWNVALWGIASGIMVAASLFGLVEQGLAYGSPLLLGLGIAAGVVLVVAGHRVIDEVEHSPRQYEQADFKKLVLILGVLTIHSFPEGVAVGVSFSGLDVAGATTIGLFGVALPVLAVFMVLAIAVQNIPEGIAVSIPLRSLDVSEKRMVMWAIFSSLPQPIGAVIAFSFVSLAKVFLPVGFGFAAGAMIYLVATELIPEALEYGTGLPGRGWRELIAGALAGVLVMVPLEFL